MQVRALQRVARKRHTNTLVRDLAHTTLTTLTPAGKVVARPLPRSSKSAPDYRSTFFPLFCTTAFITKQVEKLALPSQGPRPSQDAASKALLTGTGSRVAGSSGVVGQRSDDAASAPFDPSIAFRTTPFVYGDRETFKPYNTLSEEMLERLQSAAGTAVVVTGKEPANASGDDNGEGGDSDSEYTQSDDSFTKRKREINSVRWRQRKEQQLFNNMVVAFSGEAADVHGSAGYNPTLPGAEVDATVARLDKPMGNSGYSVASSASSSSSSSSGGGGAGNGVDGSAQQSLGMGKWEIAQVITEVNNALRVALGDIPLTDENLPPPREADSEDSDFDRGGGGVTGMDSELPSGAADTRGRDNLKATKRRNLNRPTTADSNVPMLHMSELKSKKRSRKSKRRANRGSVDSGSSDSRLGGSDGEGSVSGSSSESESATDSDSAGGPGVSEYAADNRDVIVRHSMSAASASGENEHQKSAESGQAPSRIGSGGSGGPDGGTLRQQTQSEKHRIHRRRARRHAAYGIASDVVLRRRMGACAMTVMHPAATTVHTVGSRAMIAWNCSHPSVTSVSLQVRRVCGVPV